MISRRTRARDDGGGARRGAAVGGWDSTLGGGPANAGCAAGGGDRAGRGALSTALLTAEVQEPHGEEPRVSIEHRRPLRQLRRLGQSGPDQLGGQVREGRRRRRDLVVRARRDARPHHAELRDHRPRRVHSVLEEARRAGARRKRLQVHPAVEPRRPSAGRARNRVCQGSQLHRQQGSAARVRVRAGDGRADSGHRQSVRAGRPARARSRRGWRRAARRERLSHHAVPQLGDQRPQGRLRRRAQEPRPLRHRDRPRDSRRGRPRLSPADEDQRD